MYDLETIIYSRASLSVIVVVKLISRKRKKFEHEKRDDEKRRKQAGEITKQKKEAKRRRREPHERSSKSHQFISNLIAKRRRTAHCVLLERVAQAYKIYFPYFFGVVICDKHMRLE